MKKRVAYIGLSYPLFYDYGNLARRTRNDRFYSPNPIIESPLGLMIMYDELLFLCRSVCPNNMRNLPYVKFVDEIYPDFYFVGALHYIDEMYDSISINAQLSFQELAKRMSIESWNLDIHTHNIEIGDLSIFGKPIKDNFIFDIYVFNALQKQYDEDIELVANSYFCSNKFNRGIEAEYANRIVIKNIPNYVSADGPYHECIEYLREHSYLIDFRKWMTDKHEHLQHIEIDDVCEEVEHAITETKDKVFDDYLNNNSGFAYFESIGSTLVKTVASNLVLPISFIEAFSDVLVREAEYFEAKSVRWQKFVTDAWEKTK